jgi:hypothetical protein
LLDQAAEKEKTRTDRSVVKVEELLAVKRDESLKNPVADSARSDGADDLALEIKRSSSDLSDVPSARNNLLMSGDKVPNEEEDGHHNVLGDRDDVGSGNLSAQQTT